DMGTLQVLAGIMEKKAENSSIINSCCWLIKAFDPGTEDQKQAIINNGLLTKIVKIMQMGDSECQKQCSIALGNLITV
ncbi:hypothetical protein PMAYCL1PPCAC_26443, partial [Pristionchus mayeri]